MRSPELAAALELERVFGPYDPRALGHFAVIRDDGRGHCYEDTGFHGIHRESFGTTNGCKLARFIHDVATEGRLRDTSGQA